MDLSPPRILFTVYLICCWLPSSASAVLRSPLTVQTADSASAQFMQGVDYARLKNFFAERQEWKSGVMSVATGTWKTEWQKQRSSINRIRQDGNWYVGVAKPIRRGVQLWGAGYGEHFDDRPLTKGGNPLIAAELYPKDPFVETATRISSSETANATRVLRGGAGLSYTPMQPLSIHTGTGIVDDKRIGQHEAGLGVWSAVDLEQWMTGGFLHDGSLIFKRESPENHYSLDLTGNYELFREFFPGNTNRAELSGGIIERDVYRGALLPASRRSEQQFLFRDELEYEIADRVSVSMSGDFQRETTDLGGEGVSGADLEEQQNGLAVSLKGAYRKSAGQASLSIRSVSQTIRGEILNGRKTEAAFLGSTMLPDHSNLGLRLAVSKYTLDTRSDQNFDDRDELGFRIESKWVKALRGTLVYELRALAHLDHLVYIFEETSANNRWTRLFLLGSAIRHTPCAMFTQEFQFAVSANYQAYDFEFNPKATRSTVFRRFSAGDSVAVHFTESFWIDTRFTFQIEELGRLYWEEFEEARSDETKSWSISAALNRKLTRRFIAGAGYLWNRRYGDQFTNSEDSLRERFQDLNSYGPQFYFRYLPDSGIFFTGSGRVLRQFELNQEARWILSGTITGGVRW
ncbi:hypothetical protein KKC97_03210 [bacterium]|nr:hypothetical protein [bacterium]